MPMKSIFGRQIYDSCGIPTVEVDLITDLGLFRADVPSGSTKGTNEALELRDEDGRGVTQAVANVNEEVGPALLKQNFEVTQQKEIDEFLIKLDGTENKSKFGANAIFGISMAVAKAGAAKRGIPLYRHIATLAGNKNVILPVPVFVVLNGGKNAGNSLPMEEFTILPTGAKSFHEAMIMGSEVYSNIKDLIFQKYGSKGITVGDDGGFQPAINKPKDVFTLIMKAIQIAGYGGKVEIGMGVAASEFYKEGLYDMDFKNKKSNKKNWLDTKKLIKLYQEFLKSFPIVSIEDPFDSSHWAPWTEITETTGIQIVGNALTASNSQLIKNALEKKLCNCLVLKVNQIGTVTEGIEAYLLAKENRWGTIVSHRTGETEDTFIADFVVGLSTGQIKTGAPCRSERLAKYNQLLRIEEELGTTARYAGKAFRRP